MVGRPQHTGSTQTGCAARGLLCLHPRPSPEPPGAECPRRVLPASGVSVLQASPPRPWLEAPADQDSHHPWGGFRDDEKVTLEPNRPVLGLLWALGLPCSSDSFSGKGLAQPGGQRTLPPHCRVLGCAIPPSLSWVSRRQNGQNHAVPAVQGVGTEEGSQQKCSVTLFRTEPRVTVQPGVGTERHAPCPRALRSSPGGAGQRR